MIQRYFDSNGEEFFPFAAPSKEAEEKHQAFMMKRVMKLIRETLKEREKRDESPKF